MALGPARLGKLYDRLEGLKDEEIAILDRIAEGGGDGKGKLKLDLGRTEVPVVNERKRPAVASEDEDREGLTAEEELLEQQVEYEDREFEQDDYDEPTYKERIEAWLDQNRDCDLSTIYGPLAEQDCRFGPLHPVNDQLNCPEQVWTKLLHYQQQGIEWLADLFGRKVGGILGDEMGLGKTVQIIALIAALQASGRLKQPMLIVAPVTLLQQWLQELHVWWPPLRVFLLHSSQAHDGKRVLKKAASFGHVILTSYGHLAKLQSSILKAPWRLVVLDEGHKIRNPDAGITLVCKQLRTPHRLILSGTPIQNSLTELWSLLDFCYPGRLGTLPVFKAEFVGPIMAGGYANASSLQVQTSYRCALHLGELLRPFLLRRLKADVANELPAKHEQVLFCQLGPYQRQLYEFLLDSEIIQSVLAGQRNILAGIDLLRKVCNHPHLLSLDATADVLDWPGCPMPFGDVSGKLTVVGEVLRLWRQGGHRVLLFCQTRQMLDIVEEHVIGLGFEYLRMDGTTPVKERGQLVDRFNGDPSITVFLLTTRVGGLGLNLIGADRVLIYDPDWNPSTDLQARERAWRLGQRRPVTIYRLITAGTIEEKIYHRQIFKQYLTNRILKDPKQSRFFKTSDLYDLFTLAPPHETNPTETGELFSGLGLEIKRKLNREDRRDSTREPLEATPSTTPKDDSHILESLFEMTGLHSAIQHDQLVEKPRHEAVLVEREAARIAKEAADALRRSREERLERSVEEVTWTGGPRFKPPPIPSARMPKTGLPSSADILATIRQRNDAKKQEGPILDKSLANILDRLLLFFDENGGVCKSEAIAERFKRILQPGQEAPFRHMLKTIARFDPLSKAWHLQRSLFDDDDNDDNRDEL